MHKMWAALLCASLAFTAVGAQPAPSPSSTTTSAAGPSSSNGTCTRESILNQISAISELSVASSAIVALNATVLLPNKKQAGTIFLPNDNAFSATGISVSTLLQNFSSQLTTVLAYHSLLGQKTLYNRAALLKDSPIQTDLGILSDSLNGTTGSYVLNITKGKTSATRASKVFGEETLHGVANNNTATIGGGSSVQYCGIIIYPITSVLIPAASLAEVPTDLAPVLATLDPNSADLDDGLGAAVKAGTVKLSNSSANSTSTTTTTTVIAGAALALGGTNSTITTTGPSILAGTVTPTNGTAIGPGLIYLNGTVTNGVGNNGTATGIESISSSGKVKLNKTESVDLTGATVNGTAFDGRGFTDISSSGTTAAGAAVFAVVTTTSTGLNSTGPILLDGKVVNGTALNTTAATGEAVNGTLGTGAILVNGTVTNGVGVDGTAYPVVSFTKSGMVVNKDNGLNITGATVTGSAFNVTGVKVKTEAEAQAGGAGAASGETASSPSSSGSTSSTSGSSSAPAPAPSSAPLTTAAAPVITAAAAGVAILLLATMA